MSAEEALNPLDEIQENNSDPGEGAADGESIEDHREVQEDVAPATLKKNLPIYQRPAPLNPRRRPRQ